MRFAIAALLLACSSVASAQTICINGRCTLRPPAIIVQNVVSAQVHAEHLAATGSFSHCTKRGSVYEGLGFGSSPEAACRNACFWGRRPVREIGTAWCPLRRGWVAVVRYE